MKYAQTTEPDRKSMRIKHALFVLIREHSRATLLLFCSLFLMGCDEVVLPEGGFAARAVLSKEIIHVGDVVTLTLTARHAPGSTVQFPDIGNRKQIVVRGISTDSVSPAKGVLETEEIIRLTSLRPGHWLLTTNPVVCTFADGTQKAQALPPLTLTVESTLDEKNATALSDIKGPIRNLTTVFWVIGLVIAIALVAGLITRYLTKRPANVLDPTTPTLPPHITAQNALAALKTEPWEPEPFFVKASIILRTYLEGRFTLNAPECTTEELTQKLPQEHRTFLETFFEQSDLVKFARADAQQDVMQTAFSTIEEFVNKTKETDHELHESTPIKNSDS